MSELTSDIRVSLERCNLAYELYLEDEKYYQAKRIYKANTKLYELLELYLYESKENHKETIKFLFHLEDWFEQFKELENNLKDTLNLNSDFVFTRLEKSPEFPINFLKNIK